MPAFVSLSRAGAGRFSVSFRGVATSLIRGSMGSGWVSSTAMGAMVDVRWAIDYTEWNSMEARRTRVGDEEQG